MRGTSTGWPADASSDFEAFVAARRGVHQLWGVPATIFRYISGQFYLGTLVIRHELTDDLFDVGGHIGYHVVAPWRRQGHATRMLRPDGRAGAARTASGSSCDIENMTLAVSAGRQTGRPARA